MMLRKEEMTRRMDREGNQLRRVAKLAVRKQRAGEGNENLVSGMLGTGTIAAQTNTAVALRFPIG